MLNTAIDERNKQNNDATKLLFDNYVGMVLPVYNKNYSKPLHYVRDLFCKG